MLYLIKEKLNIYEIESKIIKADVIYVLVEILRK